MSESKLKVGFIGIGQAGNNIADVAELFGYRTAVCNTSPEDLESVQLVKNKVLLGSNGGAAKDRKMAKRDAKDNYNKIVDLIKNKFNGINMIYFVFSAGGGTGSGMSPMMIDVVRRLIPDKKFGCVTILPSKSESIVAQINALECLKEIIRLEIPSFIADNEKLASRGKTKTRKDLFDKMNNYIIDSFNLILNTDRIASKYGNLDQQDIIRLLSTPGVSIITTSNIGSLEKKEKDFSFGKKIMSSWDNSFFAPLQYDDKITRMGFIYEVSDEVTKMVDYEEIKNEIGNPLEIFEGYYQPEDKNDIVISILSGLSYPIKRINEIKKIIEGGKHSSEEVDYDSVFSDTDLSWFDEARNKKTLTTIQGDLDEMDDEDEFDEFEEDDEITGNGTSIRKTTKKKKKEFDIEDIFANYE